MSTDDDVEDLLDRPIRDLFQNYDTSIESKDPLTRGEIWLLFGHLHPASAGQMLNDIHHGIKQEGFTAQGVSHKDYQRQIELMKEDS